MTIYETVVPGDGKNKPKRRVSRRLGIKWVFLNIYFVFLGSNDYIWNSSTRGWQKRAQTTRFALFGH